MTSNTIYHYVYRITNLVENKHYYGKRSSKCDPKEDLGVKYFSSSSDKMFMLDQKSNPQNYRYKIVQSFCDAIIALAREVKLHSKFNVGINEKFYNKVKQTSVGFNFTGGKVSAEAREKLSKAFKGKPRSEEIKAKIAKSNSGKIRSAESKSKQSERQKGKPGHKHTEQTKSNLAEIQRGRCYSEESKRKMSVAKKGKPFHYTEENKLNQSKAQRKFYYITPIGTIDRPDLLDPIITSTQLIWWMSNLDRKITKTIYANSNYLNSNFSLEQILGKTFRELGFNKVKKQS